MVRYYKGQNYSKIKKECEASGNLFVDPEFKAVDSSLFYSKTAPFSTEWKRPKDISENPKLFVEGADTKDVTQGKLGNCWFVAACANLAQDSSLWSKVIPDYKDQEWDDEKPEKYQGIFRFRFWRFGEWIEVVVDDLLPTVNGELVYVKSATKNEFWSALLEKAYAKINNSYEALEGGNTGDALVDFTGGVTEPIDLREGGYSQDFDKRLELFDNMKKAMSQHALISASIRIKNRDEMEKRTDVGLVMGHAYGVTAVKKIKIGDGFLSLFNKQVFYMVRLRNPWGEKEWNGPWSDGSEEWNKLKASDRESLGITFEDDGEFWMTFEDFCHHFTNASICRLINTSVFSLRKTWHEFSSKDEWKQGHSAGGCIENKSTFLTNPQFAFTVTDKDEGDVMIAIMQEDKRPFKSEGKENMTIGYFIMRVEENRKYRLHSIMEKAGDSVFINSREVFNKHELSAGRYVVVPSVYEPNKEGKFMVRIWTENSSSAIRLVNHHPERRFLWCCIPWCRQPVAVLSVVVVNATGLQKTGYFGVGADPYVHFKCEGYKVDTPCKKDTLNPKYDSGALFFIRKPATAMLKVQIWDKNPVKDTFMGQVKIPVEVNNKTSQMSYGLKGRGRGHAEESVPGKITVRYTCFGDLKGI